MIPPPRDPRWPLFFEVFFIFSASSFAISLKLLLEYLPLVAQTAFAPIH